MKQLNRMLCLLLVCVLVGGLLPMTAAAEDIKITAMEFTVENLAIGEKGTAVKAHVAGDQPITLNNLATLRYDDAGEPGLLVKSDLLQEGKIYWLCINPVVKSGYSLTPYVMLQKESWTINGLPYGMAIDKVVQSGSQVRFRLTPLLKAIDTLSITGVPAPKYGQKVKEYYTVWTDVFDKGTGKVNGVAYAGNWLFEGIFLAAGAILNEGKHEIDPETQISADTYYMWYMFECVPGRVFTDDIQVSVEGAISAEAEFYDDALLVYAKYEVSEPIFTKQPVGGTVASGETKTVKWTTNFPPVKNVLFKVKTHPVDGMKITSENLGTATTAEVGAGYEYYIIRSYYSDSGYVNSEKFYVNELETCTVTYDYESQEDVVKQFNQGVSIYDVAITYAPPAETKAGYVFDEWILSEDTPTDSLEDPENPSSTKIIGDVRLVPRWLKCYDEIHFEFSGYELGANISDGVLTDDIDGYAPQKMPDLLGGNNYVIVADKGGKPDMTDPNTMFMIVTGKFEANTDYWLMIMIGGEGRDITGDIKLDAAGIDDCFVRP